MFFLCLFNLFWAMLESEPILFLKTARIVSAKVLGINITIRIKTAWRIPYPNKNFVRHDISISYVNMSLCHIFYKNLIHEINFDLWTYHFMCEICSTNRHLICKILNRITYFICKLRILYENILISFMKWKFDMWKCCKSVSSSLVKWHMKFS